VRSEAVWCLTNIATGDHTQTAHVLQAVPDLLHLLASGDASLQEQACWAIGNIAGDSDEFRAALVANGALAPLLTFLAASTAAQPPQSTCAQTAAWAVSNLSRGSTSTAAFVTSGALPLLLALTSHSDLVVSTEMWWLFYYLSGREDEAVNCMIQVGMADAINLAITSANPSDITTVPIVRTLGNLTSGAPEWTSELLLRPTLLPALAMLLNPVVSDKSVLKETLWVAGNLFGGSAESRISAIRAGLLNQVFTLLMTDQCDLQREAVFAIRNACVERDAVLSVVQHGGKQVLHQLVSLIRVLDSEISLACLHILRVVALESPDELRPQIVESYNEAGLYDILEELQYGSNPPDVRRAALALINDVFESDDALEESTEAPVAHVFGDVGGSGGMGRGRHLAQPSWLR